MKVVSTCEKNNQLCSFAVKLIHSKVMDIINKASTRSEAKNMIVDYVLEICGEDSLRLLLKAGGGDVGDQ